MPDDFVTLHGAKVELASNAGREFVVDVVRAAEGLGTDNDLQRKYEISPREWEALIDDTALIRAVRNERDRRVRSGLAAKELAAKHFAKAPNVLESILNDKAANPRHRIESARELRATAAGTGDESAASAGAKFEIRIDISGGSSNKDDIIEISKPIAPMKPLLPINEPTFKVIDDER